MPVRRFFFCAFLLTIFLCAAAAENACGHNWAVISRTPPSCTQEGTETRQCSLCGAESTLPLPRIDHSYEGASWSVLTPATCVSPGTGTRVCVHCGGGAFYKDLPALGHAWESATQSATCTQAGSVRRSCSRCGETQTEILPATGHSEITDPGKSATCTQTGLSEGKHCTVCGAVTRAQQSIPARGHRYVTAGGVSPSCTQPGKEAETRCQDCGYTTGGAVIPAAGHREKGDGNRKEPTCTETGLTESKRCSVCGVQLSGQKKIAARGHRENTDAPLLPTLWEGGLTEGTHCRVCGEVLKAPLPLPALSAWPGLEKMPAGLTALPDAARVQFLPDGKSLEMLLPLPDGNGKLHLIAREGKAPVIYCLATSFDAAPTPAFEALLTQGDFPRALPAHPHYAPFFRSAAAWISGLDETLTEEEATAWLLTLCENAGKTEGDPAGELAAWAENPAALSLLKYHGHEYALLSNGVNLFLLLRPASP